jgi:hypothetical protein
MTWVIMRAMTTTNGTPSNQRMIGMTASLAIDPHGINQIDNSSSGSWFQNRSSWFQNRICVRRHERKVRAPMVGARDA